MSSSSVSPPSSYVFSEKMIRPVISGGVAIALDRLVLGQTDIKKNLIFGATVGAGIAVGSFAGSLVIPEAMDTSLSFGNGKQIGTRALELGVSGMSSFLVSKYLMKESDKSNTVKKIAVILACDIAGEVACDYMSGRPIAYLA